MQEICKRNSCCGCYACKNVCPKNAISMKEDAQGFEYPVINAQFCINCGLCKKVCPILNKKVEADNLPKAYAGYNKNTDIRMESSSGGIFTEISKKIIEDDGVIFGAIFDEKFNVIHEEISDISNLGKIRGSKYIQSQIKDTYKRARKYLEEGRKVLFTGTPCQIEGLYSYLRKDYENLYTQDLICHGVPSKKIWKKYLEYRELKDDGKITNLSFRNKHNKGWNNYQTHFEYEGKQIDIDHNEDYYMRLFLSDIALRPSCYECQFKKKHKMSDITLADFWGINEIMPEMNDEKGTSLIIVNSEKGNTLLNSIKTSICIAEVEFEKAIKSNKSMYQSPELEKQKNDIYKDLEKLDIEEIVKKYLS
jgi:coenzyme F420-reducing hydrogenase beta subunit